MSVEVRGNNLEGAIKRFKTEVARSGTLTAAKKHAEYKKPGVQRREAIKEGIKNSRKNSKKYNERRAA